MTDPAKIGNSIKTLRLNAGYTQRELAEYMCVTAQAVSKWERGLSIPDISIITKLSLLLNVDVDNLLEGNIAYLEKKWQGLLILGENEDVFSGTEVYGKPLVYIFLSYFLLAGIGSIYISCPERDKEYISARLGDGGTLGAELHFLDGGEMPPGNTMVVYNNPFVFGSNLTKYFQRAMSRAAGISILTVGKSLGAEELMISADNTGNIMNLNSVRDYFVPIVFFPYRFFGQVGSVKEVRELKPLYAEPMGNGIIEYAVTDEDSLLDTSVFMRLMKKRMGKDIYDLEEIAKKRCFIGQ